MIFTNGRKYVGGWKNGGYDGQGTITSPDGNKYVGEYKDGKQHGQGTHTYPDGSSDVGEWREGLFFKGTHYDKDGNIIGKYVNGVEQK